MPKTSQSSVPHPDKETAVARSSPLNQSSLDFRTRPWLAAVLAVTTFLAATALRFLLRDTFPPGFPFLTYFPAVVMTAYLAGWRAGVACAVMSTLAAWYYFIPPFESFALDSSTSVALAFFVMVVGVMIFVIHRMQLAVERFTVQQRRSDELAKQQQTLFRELQHRVANNMQFVASLLQLHRSRAMTDPSRAVAALDEANQRLAVMARIHRRLYDPAVVDQPIDQYFTEMCHDLLEATGARNIVLLIDMPNIQFDLDRLMTLSLLITEIVTNSLKHAFVGRDSGTISLTLRTLDPGQLELVVADDGIGMAAATNQKAGHGLGSIIIESLAGQLQGSISTGPAANGGTSSRIAFSI